MLGRQAELLHSFVSITVTLLRWLRSYTWGYSLLRGRIFEHWWI